MFAIHNSCILGCHCTLSCASGQQLVHIQWVVCWRFTSVAIAVCVLLEGFPMVQYPFWHRLRYAAGWQDQSLLWLCRQTSLGPNLQTNRTFLEFYQQYNAVMCGDTFCWVDGASWPIILSKKQERSQNTVANPLAAWLTFDPHWHTPDTTLTNTIDFR